MFPTPAGSDPQYLDGLRMSVTAAVEYALTSLEAAESTEVPVPSVLLSQARLAARSQVPLDVVLRRYFAGFALISDFVFTEACEVDAPASMLQALMRGQAVRFDRLIEAVAADYVDEQKKARRSGSERRLAVRLQSLLDGELVDVSEFQYEFEGFHVGGVGIGRGAEAAIRKLASLLDRTLLLVRPRDGVVWAWIGGKREVNRVDLGTALACLSLEGGALAVGEPAEGLAGWRLTHRQAKVALPISERRKAVVRYSDVALLGALTQDELLAASLREIYLKPLERSRDGGESALRTLRAYFAAGRNVSSAAAALGVSRRTVTNRLRLIEVKLSRPLAEVMSDVEAALLLDELEADRALTEEDANRG